MFAPRFLRVAAGMRHVGAGRARVRRIPSGMEIVDFKCGWSIFSICGAAQLMQCCLKADHRLIHIKESFIHLLFCTFIVLYFFYFFGCFHTFLHIYLDTESMFSHG